VRNLLRISEEGVSDCGQVLLLDHETAAWLGRRQVTEAFRQQENIFMNIACLATLGHAEDAGGALKSRSRCNESESIGNFQEKCGISTSRWF